MSGGEHRRRNRWQLSVADLVAGERARRWRRLAERLVVSHEATAAVLRPAPAGEWSTVWLEGWEYWTIPAGWWGDLSGVEPGDVVQVQLSPPPAPEKIKCVREWGIGLAERVS